MKIHKQWQRKKNKYRILQMQALYTGAFDIADAEFCGMQNAEVLH